jgi:hypothetical protein
MFVDSRELLFGEGLWLRMMGRCSYLQVLILCRPYVHGLLLLDYVLLLAYLPPLLVVSFHDFFIFLH